LSKFLSLKLVISLNLLPFQCEIIKQSQKKHQFRSQRSIIHLHLTTLLYIQSDQIFEKSKLDKTNLKTTAQFENHDNQVKELQYQENLGNKGRQK